MSIYTVELATPKLDNVVKFDVQAKSFSGAEKETKKLYDWAKPITIKSIRLNEDPEASYNDKVNYIPLTGSQKWDISCCILMTTNYREKEMDTWKSLSEEKDENGDPKFPNAESNSRFWAGLNERLEVIKGILDNA